MDAHNAAHWKERVAKESKMKAYLVDLMARHQDHMKGADLVTASVAAGKVRAEDRHAHFAPTTYSDASLGRMMLVPTLTKAPVPFAGAGPVPFSPQIR